MYGGSSKHGRLGGGAGAGRGAGAAKLGRASFPPPHRSSAPAANRLSLGGSNNPRGGRNSATATSSAAAAPAVEEKFSLVAGSNPVAFSMIIRLAPDLVDEIRRVEAQGGTPRIKFDSVPNNPHGNVIDVGGKEFRFTWSRDGDLCDIYEERETGEDGNGLLVESGCAWRKVNVQRILDESTTNHVKRRSQEAERSHKSRKAIVLEPNPAMNNQLKQYAAASVNIQRRNKLKKEPPSKKQKVEPPQAAPKSAYKSGISATTAKGRQSSSPLPSTTEKSPSPFGMLNISKTHANADETIPSQVILKDKPAPSLDKKTSIRSTATLETAGKGSDRAKPTDLQSLLIILLMENPKGMSFKALERAIGDSFPNSAKKIESILKKIANCQAPGRYLLKPGVMLESFKKPCFESGRLTKDYYYFFLNCNLVQCFLRWSLAAPLETLGRAAVELQIKKRTRIGMDLQFEWEEVDAFVRQPDGSLFSWCERFQCYRHLIYGIMNKGRSAETLRFEGKEFYWEIGEHLLKKLESQRIVKDVFPLHDEVKRKKLLHTWALHWWDFTSQPIDEVYSYFGTKIAIYFAFLGMYTQWLLFPATFGLILQIFDFGSLQLLVLPLFFISITLWAIMFSQFWKRKNVALLARWHISYPIRTDLGNRQLGTVWSSPQSSVELMKKWGTDKTKEKEMFQRIEWFGRLMRFRNDAIIIVSIICLQLPFELAYAHLYEVIESDIVKFGLTTVYLFSIQFFTQLGGKVSVKLINYENNENREKRADSLVYKVFGLYFMQSYIGVFYHALLHRNFLTLRTVLIQRLLVSEVLENLVENTLPYLKYSYKKFRVRSKKKRERGSSTGRIQFSSRVEKEYLKPSYSASIGMELEDGLFDDFLELTLQFGMIMMFACALPPAFAFAAVNNLTEIRTDALKLLVMHKRPIPRVSITIGAWLNIFQFLVVTSICTNCALLVWLYDHEGKWNIEPGLAAILIMEHILLLIKFGFSRFVPEEPAWVQANRVKNATEAEYLCSKQLLRNISGGERAGGVTTAAKKTE